MSDIQPTEEDREAALKVVKSIMDLHPFDCGQDDCRVCPRHRNEAIAILVGYVSKVVTTYQEVIDDYRRLTKELDDALNGEEAAKAPSLCDIVAQVKREDWKLTREPAKGSEDVERDIQTVFAYMRWADRSREAWARLVSCIKEGNRG